MVLSDADLRSALRRIGVDAPVRFDEVTGSTQATALALAGQGAPEWTLVAAGHQTAGRGRLGRTWLDAPGALLVSIVLRPPVEPERAGLLTLLAGLGMAEALGDSGVEVGCKWPNDLLVDEQKVGGILAESVVREGRLAHVVLGLGVNLAGAPEVPGARGLGGLDAATVLGAFLEVFARDERAFAAGAVGGALDRYRWRCVTLGRPVRATTVEGQVVEGVAEDVDGDGALLVRTDEGVRTIRSGEVEHLRPPALPG
jgi:BirA family biotin operon repressor/biotin-[acetyl-CoA-carboxylase] ligase